MSISPVFPILFGDNYPDRPVKIVDARHDRFRDVGRNQAPKWPNGYVLERALEALERKMKAGKGRGQSEQLSADRSEPTGWLTQLVSALGR